MFLSEFDREAYDNAVKEHAKAEGLAEGLAEGKLKGKLANLLELVEDGILTEDDAIQRSGVTPEEYFSYKKEWEESKE